MLGPEQTNEEVLESSSNPVDHHIFRKRFMVLSLIFAALPHIFASVDERIGGRWSEYPPLNFLKHPSEDFFLDFGQIVEKYGGRVV